MHTYIHNTEKMERGRKEGSQFSNLGMCDVGRK